jgi:ADP-ribosylglycohydrolase
MRSVVYEDRVAGCLLGGALGDAIGSHFEGQQPPVPFQIPASLHVTDDTQLTIATCESIIEVQSLSAESIAANFVRWFRARRLRGIGASTLKSLIELEAGGHWALVGATGEKSAGSGAAMRIAPLAFILNPDDPRERQTIRDVCRITHRNEEAYVGGLAIVRAIRYVVAGHPCDDQLLIALIDTLPDSCVRDRLIESHEATLSIVEYAKRYSTSGYVVDAVPLAILAAVRSNDCLETIQDIVECGGDTDTIASMYGNIFGAAFGAAALPTDVVQRIDVALAVLEVAKQFAQTADECVG